MKICDRCEKKVDSLNVLSVIEKTWSDGKAMSLADAEVCDDCFMEGKELLDSLGTQLDKAVRAMMIEAKDEWLASEVRHTEESIIDGKYRGYTRLNDTGRSRIKSWKEKLIEICDRFMEGFKNGLR